MYRLPVVALWLLFSCYSYAAEATKYLNERQIKGMDVSEYANLKGSEDYNVPQTLDGLLQFSSDADNKYVRQYYMDAGVKPEDIDKFFLFIKNKGHGETGTTIFFLTSNSVPKNNTVNFMKGFDILKKKNPDLQGYVVMNGFMKTKGGFKTYLDSLEISHSEVKSKIHPFLFEHLKLNVVPAYVISECPIHEFKEKHCVHKIIMRGEVGLEKFLNTVNENSDEEKYKKLYFDLITP